MRARYDLSRNPVSYNFLEFLVAATTRGVTHISFDLTRGFTNKFSDKESMKRLDNILMAACDLAGVQWEIGGLGKDMPYHMDAVLSAYQELGYIKKLQNVMLVPKAPRYTVTIRDYDRQPKRNSNIPAWERFASDIGAHIIQDSRINGIDIRHRMALYSAAEMNFFVTNGPAALCYFSDAPMLGFLKYASRTYHAKHGWPIGSTLPWLNSRQHFEWTDDDSYENIWRVWDRFSAERKAA